MKSSQYQKIIETCIDSSRNNYLGDQSDIYIGTYGFTNSLVDESATWGLDNLSLVGRGVVRQSSSVSESLNHCWNKIFFKMLFTMKWKKVRLSHDPSWICSAITENYPSTNWRKQFWWQTQIYWPLNLNHVTKRIGLFRNIIHPGENPYFCKLFYK